MTSVNTHTKRIIAALALGCFFIMACENDVNEVKNLSVRKTGIEEGRNIVSYLSVGGKMKAKLTAPLLLRYQGDSALKSEFPQSLYVEFFNDSTKIESKLRAKYGRYLEQENKVYLRDSVVIIRIHTGDTLYTSEMFWDQTAGIFYTDKPVTTVQRFTEQKTYARKGFRATQDLSSITYFEAVEGSYLIIPPDSTKKN
ncbi:MAG: LPS export ABC transporter periplasmic protein LptC [Sediminibacterium sp.]|jgi:LPS export ABC transporter protein LptC|nr:LPS export ABC transporter periplasmic protein LptC [Sediminibacterium sp.]MCA6440506.1 LPS export ABC transporter periplasmic protein LptC [Chitinophagaceae bacterium]MCA6446381.1 LPS export ABC transporter periplasmic protein LptC [Chitinophagaceae bacterium]